MKRIISRYSLCFYSLQRAFTLASRAFHANEVQLGNESMADTLPLSVHPDQFVDLLCEPCDPPPFVGAYKRKT